MRWKHCFVIYEGKDQQRRKLYRTGEQRDATSGSGNERVCFWDSGDKRDNIILHEQEMKQ